MPDYIQKITNLRDNSKTVLQHPRKHEQTNKENHKMCPYSSSSCLRKSKEAPRSKIDSKRCYLHILKAEIIAAAV